MIMDRATEIKLCYDTKTVKVVYKGVNKIFAVKTIREIYGLTLKSAKDIVEYEGGFLVTTTMLDIIRNLYESKIGNFTNTDFNNNDWHVIPETLPPIENL